MQLSRQEFVSMVMSKVNAPRPPLTQAEMKEWCIFSPQETEFLHDYFRPAYDAHVSRSKALWMQYESLEEYVFTRYNKGEHKKKFDEFKKRSMYLTVESRAKDPELAIVCYDKEELGTIVPEESPVIVERRRKLPSSELSFVNEESKRNEFHVRNPSPIFEFENRKGLRYAFNSNFGGLDYLCLYVGAHVVVQDKLRERALFALKNVAMPNSFVIKGLDRVDHYSGLPLYHDGKRMLSPLNFCGTPPPHFTRFFSTLPSRFKYPEFYGVHRDLKPVYYCFSNKFGPPLSHEQSEKELGCPLPPCVQVYHDDYRLLCVVEGDPDTHKYVTREMAEQYVQHVVNRIIAVNFEYLGFSQQFYIGMELDKSSKALMEQLFNAERFLLVGRMKSGDPYSPMGCLLMTFDPHTARSECFYRTGYEDTGDLCFSYGSCPSFAKGPVPIDLSGLLPWQTVPVSSPLSPVIQLAMQIFLLRHGCLGTPLSLSMLSRMCIMVQVGLIRSLRFSMTMTDWFTVTFKSFHHDTVSLLDPVWPWGDIPFYAN